MINVNKLPISFYLEKFRKNEVFSLSRFGDGEVLCMFKDGITLERNCDGSKFFESLNEPMRQIFRNQYDYYHCLLDCSFDLNGDLFEAFLNETCPNLPFYDGEIWQSVSGKPEMLELIGSIAIHNPIIIGGAHLAEAKYIYGLSTAGHILTNSSDSFLQYEQIKQEILEKHKAGSKFFCFCTGYTSKILIDDLFPEIGHDSFLIDFGSFFDPYCGRLSRSGMVSSGFLAFQPYTSYNLIK